MLLLLLLPLFLLVLLLSQPCLFQAVAAVQSAAACSQTASSLESVWATCMGALLLQAAFGAVVLTQQSVQQLGQQMDRHHTLHQW